MSMSKKGALLTTVAALSLSATGAFAEKHATEEAKTDAEVTTMAEASSSPYGESYGGIADTQFADLVGMNVLSETGEDVGEVDTFVLMEDELKAVVGVGGFLGLGEHDVAIGLDQMTYNGDALVINFTREELEAMPEYTEELQAERMADTSTLNTYRGDIGGEMEAEDGQALADGETTIETDTEAGETEMASEDATDVNAETDTETEMASEDATEVAEETEEVAENAADATEAAADEAGQELAEAGEATENAVENTGEEVADATEATENAVEGTAEDTGEALADAGEATENAVEDAGAEVADAAEATENAVEETANDAGQALADAGEATENAVEDAGAEVAAAAGAAAATADSWMDKLEAEFADIASMPVNEIEGTNVATESGEVIGEIDALARDGETLVAVVGVGGFLGLGEHDVALDMADLGWDGEKFIAEGMTEEDLKNMAEVDMDTLEQLDGDVTLTAAADM